MNAPLRAIPLNGINVDSLGHYLAGLGILVAASKRWPAIRACWDQGRFKLLSHQLADIHELVTYLMSDWKPTPYERWWNDAFSADKALVKKKAIATSIARLRAGAAVTDLGVLDSTVVFNERPITNPLFGLLAGKVSEKRTFEAPHRACLQYLNAIRGIDPILNGVAKKLHSGLKAIRNDSGRINIGHDWLNAVLLGHSAARVPEIGSTGTWFGFANRTFNSGQEWYREGHISPWAFLFAVEGAMNLIGGVNRRLGSRSRPYAVFPFVCDPCQPESDGEIGMGRGEFWAPLWQWPATMCEVKTLLQRGLSRIGGRAAQTPSEFAVAAIATGVDAGVSEFARFELRQTTSSQVFEAIPREVISVGVARDASSSYNKSISSRSESGSAHRGNGAELLMRLFESSWIDRLPPEPYDSRKKGKFVGLRGPIEAAIIRATENPDDASRWQSLLLTLAKAQAKVDRNRSLRERRMPLSPLDPKWFDLAWHQDEPLPLEIEIARAIASVGCHGSDYDLPLMSNVYGIEVQWNKRLSNQAARLRLLPFPKARPASAVWSSGSPLTVLLDVAHRRLIDAKSADSQPFANPQRLACRASVVQRILMNDGAIDMELSSQWIPPLSLIDWSQRTSRTDSRTQIPSTEPDGTALLYALAKPYFHGRNVSFDARTLFMESNGAAQLPTPELQRRVFNLLRFNSLDEALQLMRDRYRAHGHEIVMPPSGFIADGERVASVLLVPLSDRAVADGVKRWLQPVRAPATSS